MIALLEYLDIFLWVNVDLILFYWSISIFTMQNGLSNRQIFPESCSLFLNSYFFWKMLTKSAQPIYSEVLTKCSMWYSDYMLNARILSHVRVSEFCEPVRKSVTLPSYRVLNSQVFFISPEPFSQLFMVVQESQRFEVSCPRTQHVNTAWQYGKV